MSSQKLAKGQRYGRLVLLELSNERTSYDTPIWVCRCDCGKELSVPALNLTRTVRRTESCGCLAVERSSTHGLSDRPEYSVWNNMLQRCTNPNNPTFQYYGARGITVCDRWASSFANFFADMGSRPSPDHSIERRDVNGNYEPGNCYWATLDVQHSNRRDNVWLEYQGKQYTKSQLAAMAGMSIQVLNSRLNSGWSLEEAMSKPVRKLRPRKEP